MAVDYQRDDRGIATLTLDLPGARMNVWNRRPGRRIRGSR